LPVHQATMFFGGKAKIVDFIDRYQIEVSVLKIADQRIYWARFSAVAMAWPLQSIAFPCCRKRMFLATSLQSLFSPLYRQLHQSSLRPIDTNGWCILKGRKLNSRLGCLICIFVIFINLNNINQSKSQRGRGFFNYHWLAIFLLARVLSPYMSSTLSLG
jgi:hypothetical protein